MDSESSQNAPSSSATSATPQVRSRITVVCAECKRLKLKCDRRNPCGSCVKRDTTARCIYSPAAAEKVDLHSLNNRLIQVETLLAQLTSGQFTSSFPASNSWPPPPPSHGAIQASTSTSSSSSSGQPQPAPMPYTSLAIPLDDVAHIWLDHLDVTTRISLQQYTSLADSSSTNGVKVEASAASSPDLRSHDISSPEVSLPSLSTKSLPPTTIYYLSSPRPQNTANLPFPNHPPPLADSQTSVLKPTVTQALLDLLPPYMTSTPEPHAFQSLLTLAEQSTYHSYPSINWKQFRARASRMMATSFRTTPFSQSLSPEHPKGRDRDRDKTTNRNRRDTETRDPYPMPRNGNPLPPFTPSVALPAQDGSDPCVKVEGVPFFGAVCAALALGVLEASRETASTSGDAMLVDSYPPSGSSARGASSGTYLDAEYWYRLSVQALGEYERGLTLSVKTKAKTVEEYALDYLIACIFQVVFLVKGGLGPVSLESTDTYAGNSVDGGTGNKRKRDKDRDRPNARARHFNGVAAVVFPLVGKMVNIARKMGLGKDPHEIPLLPVDASGSAKKSKNRSDVAPPSQTKAISNLYDAEMRRRVWWDVLYYDVFVSDALGHEPLINDDFNTKMPIGDVDEKVFSSVSTRIPIPQDFESGSSYSRDAFQYFRVKCRLALLVRTIQRRMCASELSTTLFNYGNATSCTSKNGYGYSIDQAASMEAEVTRWLDDLPACYRLQKSTTDLTVDPILASQRCEVAITAQRLILKVYMPFLRKHATVSETVPAPHQATCGSVNAAHLIIRACSILNTVWKGHGRENMPSVSALSPAMFDFYPVTRILFDAAVVCAHASIKQTMPMMATPAEEALDLALNVFQDLRYSKKLGGAYGMGSGHAVVVGDALKLLSELKAQAVAARGAMGPSLKRKHTEVDGQDEDDEPEEEDHHLEYASPDDSEMRSPPPPVFNDLLPPPSRSDTSMTPTSQSPLSTFRIDQPLPRYANESHGKDEKSKKKKPQVYPAVGIRVRTGKEGSSMSRRRLSPPSPTSNDHAHTNGASPDSPLNGSPQQCTPPHAPPVQNHHQSAPSPLHMSVIDSERYRSRSSSLSQAPDSNPFPRRDSDPSYPPFSSSDSPRPDVPRRYTVGNYQPPVSQAPLPVQPQSQGTYGVASSQSTVIYDRAGSYDSQRGGYASSTEAYVPAQSPYLPSNSPYVATSGSLSTASSPYTTSSTNTTPTYPSPQIPTVPLTPAGQTYYSYESSPVASQAYQNPFSNGGSGSYSQESMSDVKPSVAIERYPTQAAIYQSQQSQTQWQSQPPQQQYWQASSTGNYYPSQ